MTDSSLDKNGSLGFARIIALFLILADAQTVLKVRVLRECDEDDEQGIEEAIDD
jgi:hypothetical protein